MNNDVSHSRDFSRGRFTNKERIDKIYKDKLDVVNFECGFDPSLLIKLSNLLFGADIARLGDRPIISTLMKAYGYTRSKVFAKKMLTLSDDEFIYFLNYINKWNSIITKETYTYDNCYYIHWTLKQYHTNLLEILSNNYARFEPYLEEADKLKYLLLSN